MPGEILHIDCWRKKIPTTTKEALDRYAKHRVPTGGFLRAVLEDKLFEAFNRADGENTRAMKEIVMYVWNDMPADCWGSKEKVDAWLKGSP